MAGKNTAAFGIYRTRAEAERGVDALLVNGFRTEDVSVLLPLNAGTKDFALEKETKASEGAAAGAGAGAAIGGTLGVLIAIGSIAIPGAAPFLAAGPIMAALAGAGGGSVVGGAIGGLVGMGMPEYVAKRYEGMVREGGILVSVHCDDSQWVDRAKDTLTSSGASDVASSGEASADFAVSDKPKARVARRGA
ncbi:MAG: DUF3341 domain-containing protein [Bryobacteraceae bacterium]